MTKKKKQIIYDAKDEAQEALKDDIDSFNYQLRREEELNEEQDYE